ncbi:uncharacterized protein LOC124914272 [Impatiens glandulifera]|uniref:uncharacterized protein LOC124914272 n=1 Tax=Impatiens glandulifera TaxID=253017 RepID=UPI001FB0ED26|nr:uncharacterized protein LOC124914272 [Impatiens glandulifera]
MILGSAATELNHFMEGLNATIRRDVRLSGVTTMRETIEKALIVQKDSDDIMKESQDKRNRKANVVVDALSRKTSTQNKIIAQPSLVLEFERLNLVVLDPKHECILATLAIVPDLINRIRLGQAQDPQLSLWRQRDEKKGTSLYTTKNELVYHKDRLCVLSVDSLRQELLVEAHTIPYFVHPGSTKMFKDLQMLY